MYLYFFVLSCVVWISNKQAKEIMSLNRRFAFFNTCSREGFGFEDVPTLRPRAEPINKQLVKLYDFARTNGIRVLFTQCVGRASPPLGRSPQPHTLMVPLDSSVSSWKDQIETCREIFIERPQFGSPEENRRMRVADVFHSNPATDELVRSLDVAEWIVFGVAMQACVTFAVRGLLRQGRSVTILSDALLPASVALSNLTIKESLDQLQSAGAHVETTDEFFARAQSESIQQ
ncbi:cysteine hydrolase family protein [Gimesia fumaroli]|uniref:Isochorismatase family protein n=1 Tax=Gimesia fumaroli TaxID=2527976 RepID=A0A518I9R8_9PLAN|nr:isochorismatase family protein [Gimesia fumaroli]QDV49863.1 Isochorismatase family protein [Gimesia fumaroli]